MHQQQEEAILIIKNLDDDSTIQFDPQKVDNHYTSFICQNKLTQSIWSNYWNQIKQVQEEMWDAVNNKDLKKLKQIFAKKQQVPLQVNSQSLDKWTALHYACFLQAPDIVNFLIFHGANIQAKTSINRTALHLAVIKQNLEIVKILLEKNANINSQDDDLCTPLHYATMYGYEEIVKLMFQYKSKINFKLKNFQNMTAGQCSLDAKIFKYFHNQQKEQDNYSRTMLGQMIRKTSRADHVQKLLCMTQSFQKKRSNIDQVQDESPLKKNQKRKQKFQRISNIHKLIIQDADTEDVSRIGPNDFQIIDILGKGSFGQVYLVRKKGEQTLYAMKVLLKQKVKSQNLVKYVLAERNILTLMDNPFIVKIFYAFQTKQKLFLILQYCPGGDLEKKIIREKSLSEKIVKIYAAEILIALESLHKREIIFRDLKPANVVLDQEGHAKVTDFGLSKQSQTSKSFCGSIAYLAPQMLFKKRHGFTLDWYLLGVLIFELLTGMPPYYCLNKDRLFENIKYMKLQCPKNISEDCRDIITKLLERDPQKRLGAKTDAKQIKQHPWFKDINWQDVFNRKLVPPRIKKKEIVAKKISFEPGEQQKPEQRLNGWSFLKQ